MHGVRLRVGVRTSVKGRAELTRTSRASAKVGAGVASMKGATRVCQHRMRLQERARASIAGRAVLTGA